MRATARAGLQVGKVYSPSWRLSTNLGIHRVLTSCPDVSVRRFLVSNTQGEANESLKEESIKRKDELEEKRADEDAEEEEEEEDEDGDEEGEEDDKDEDDDDDDEEEGEEDDEEDDDDDEEEDEDGDEEDEEDEEDDEEDDEEGEDEEEEEDSQDEDEKGEDKEKKDIDSAVSRKDKAKRPKSEDAVEDRDKGWRNPHRARNARGYLQGFTLGTVCLPEELKRRIAAMFRGYSKAMLRQDAIALSETLRARTRLRAGEVRRLEDDVPGIVGYKKHLAYAYCAHRLPGVYGCTYRVLNELKRRLPNWEPQTVLDYGSGPGTAIWSLFGIWPKVPDVLAVEPSEGMLETAKILLEGFPQVQWKRLLAPEEEKRDLVMASYVLTELKDEEERLAKVRQLWNQTKEGGVLMIVEPGTPIGFHVVRTARKMLLGLPAEMVKGSMIAPCPHNFKCPMGDDSWCHFEQRVQRIPVQVSVKEHITRGHEDETFSYILVAKGKANFNQEESTTFDRILRPPQKKGGHVILKTCGFDDGDIRQFLVARSAGVDVYKDARKSKWGDGFAFGDKKEVFMKRLDARKRSEKFRYADLSKPAVKSKEQRKEEAQKAVKLKSRPTKVKKRGGKKRKQNKGKGKGTKIKK